MATDAPVTLTSDRPQRRAAEAAQNPDNTGTVAVLGAGALIIGGAAWWLTHRNTQPAVAPVTTTQPTTPTQPSQPPLPVLPPPPAWFFTAPNLTQEAAQIYCDLLGGWPTQSDAEGVWTNIITLCPGMDANCGGRAGRQAVAFEIIAAPQAEFDSYIDQFVPAGTSGPDYPSAWVAAAYAVALGRWPQGGEDANWIAEFGGLQSRVNIMLGITESTEFANRILAQVAQHVATGT
jgi:hypothetical protein